MTLEILLTDNQMMLLSNNKLGQLVITIENGDDYNEVVTDKGLEITKALSMLGYDLPSEKSVKK